jgi:NTE family protein
MMKKKRVTLALQGGGALGAFTWGVLDALLEDDRLDIVGVSGASAGAMNAVVMLEGLAEGGRDRARAQLAEFWRAVSINGSLPTMEREVIESFLSIWDPFNLRLKMVQKTSEVFSPYVMNPLEINPLRNVLEELIDFELVRSADEPKLFVATTNVRTGKARIFQRQEMTADVVMASACLPTMFRAVEIDGESYWDGGYMGNPALYPLYTETDCADIILVQINPIRRENVPKTSSEIMDRLNEITFNSPLLQEFRAIEFVSRLIDDGRLDGDRYKKVRLHLVAGGEAVDRYGAAAKVNPDFDMFEDLFEVGRAAGVEFLRDHFWAIGVCGTLDPREELF